MTEHGHMPPTNTYASLEGPIGNIFTGLNDDRLAALPTEFEGTDNKYNGDNVGICKELDKFIHRAGSGWRKVQRGAGAKLSWHGRLEKRCQNTRDCKRRWG